MSDSGGGFEEPSSSCQVSSSSSSKVVRTRSRKRKVIHADGVLNIKGAGWKSEVIDAAELIGAKKTSKVCINRVSVKEHPVCNCPSEKFPTTPHYHCRDSECHYSSTKVLMVVRHETQMHQLISAGTRTFTCQACGYVVIHMSEYARHLFNCKNDPRLDGDAIAFMNSELEKLKALGIKKAEVQSSNTITTTFGILSAPKLRKEAIEVSCSDPTSVKIAKLRRKMCLLQKRAERSSMDMKLKERNSDESDRNVSTVPPNVLSSSLQISNKLVKAAKNNLWSKPPKKRYTMMHNAESSDMISPPSDAIVKESSESDHGGILRKVNLSSIRNKYNNLASADSCSDLGVDSSLHGAGGYDPEMVRRVREMNEKRMRQDTQEQSNVSEHQQQVLQLKSNPVSSFENAQAVNSNKLNVVHSQSSVSPESQDEFPISFSSQPYHMSSVDGIEISMIQEATRTTFTLDVNCDLVSKTTTKEPIKSENITPRSGEGRLHCTILDTKAVIKSKEEDNRTDEEQPSGDEVVEIEIDSAEDDVTISEASSVTQVDGLVSGKTKTNGQGNSTTGTSDVSLLAVCDEIVSIRPLNSQGNSNCVTADESNDQNESSDADVLNCSSDSIMIISDGSDSDDVKVGHIEISKKAKILREAITVEPGNEDEEVEIDDDDLDEQTVSKCDIVSPSSVLNNSSAVTESETAPSVSPLAIPQFQHQSPSPMIPVSSLMASKLVNVEECAIQSKKSRTGSPKKYVPSSIAIRDNQNPTDAGFIRIYDVESDRDPSASDNELDVGEEESQSNEVLHHHHEKSLDVGESRDYNDTSAYDDDADDGGSNVEEDGASVGDDILNLSSDDDLTEAERLVLKVHEQKKLSDAKQQQQDSVVTSSSVSEKNLPRDPTATESSPSTTGLLLPESTSSIGTSPTLLAADGTSDDSVPPVKRKRGRPKKNFMANRKKVSGITSTKSDASNTEKSQVEAKVILTRNPLLDSLLLMLKAGGDMRLIEKADASDGTGQRNIFDMFSVRTPCAGSKIPDEATKPLHGQGDPVSYGPVILKDFCPDLLDRLKNGGDNLPNLDVNSAHSSVQSQTKSQDYGSQHFDEEGDNSMKSIEDNGGLRDIEQNESHSHGGENSNSGKTNDIQDKDPNSNGGSFGSGEQDISLEQRMLIQRMMKEAEETEVPLSFSCEPHTSCVVLDLQLTTSTPPSPLHLEVTSIPATGEATLDLDKLPDDNLEVSLTSKSTRKRGEASAVLDLDKAALDPPVDDISVTSVPITDREEISIPDFFPPTPPIETSSRILQSASSARSSSPAASASSRARSVHPPISKSPSSDNMSTTTSREQKTVQSPVGPKSITASSARSTPGISTSNEVQTVDKVCYPSKDSGTDTASECENLASERLSPSKVKKERTEQVNAALGIEVSHRPVARHVEYDLNLEMSPIKKPTSDVQRHSADSTQSSPQQEEKPVLVAPSAAMLLDESPGPHPMVTSTMHETELAGEPQAALSPADGCDSGLDLSLHPPRALSASPTRTRQPVLSAPPSSVSSVATVVITSTVSMQSPIVQQTASTQGASVYVTTTRKEVQRLGINLLKPGSIRGKIRPNFQQFNLQPPRARGISRGGAPGVRGRGGISSPPSRLPSIATLRQPLPVPNFDIISPSPSTPVGHSNVQLPKIRTTPSSTFQQHLQSSVPTSQKQVIKEIGSGYAVSPAGNPSGNVQSVSSGVQSAQHYEASGSSHRGIQLDVAPFPLPLTQPSSYPAPRSSPDTVMPLKKRPVPPSSLTSGIHASQSTAGAAGPTQQPLNLQIQPTAQQQQQQQQQQKQQQQQQQQTSTSVDEAEKRVQQELITITSNRGRNTARRGRRRSSSLNRSTTSVSSIAKVKADQASVLGSTDFTGNVGQPAVAASGHGSLPRSPEMLKAMGINAPMIGSITLVENHKPGTGRSAAITSTITSSDSYPAGGGLDESLPLPPAAKKMKLTLKREKSEPPERLASPAMSVTPPTKCEEGQVCDTTTTDISYLDKVDANDILAELQRRKALVKCSCGLWFPSNDPQSQSLYFLHRSCHDSVDSLKCSLCSFRAQDLYNFFGHLSDHNK